MSYSSQNVKVGDRVCFSGFSDVYPGTVIARTPKSVTVREDKGTILNAPNSGEPDALQCDVGGFAAHVSGKQRWDIQENPEGRIVKFTWREAVGKWIKAGQSPKETGGKLMDGWHKHHDYNF